MLKLLSTLELERGLGVLRIFAAVLAFLTASGVLSQGVSYPTKPIQLIVASAPGGPSDTLARQLAEELAKQLGQPIVIDNKPGANGIIAGDAAKRAAPDGYTMHLTWVGNATARALSPKASFDVNKDLLHISQAVYAANILVANPSTGFKTLKDYVAHVKANPGKLSYASAGNGTSGHLAMEMLKQQAGMAIVHIPYRGGMQALTDVLSGELPVMFINQDAALPHLKTGKLIGLGITSPTRAAVAPSVPTIAEQGYPGFESTAWAGLSVPVGTSPAIVEKIHGAAVKAMQSSGFKAKQDAIGGNIVASNPSQFTAHIQRESDNWTKVVQKAGIKAD